MALGAGPPSPLSTPWWGHGKDSAHKDTSVLLSQKELILVQTQTFDGAAGSRGGLGMRWGLQEGSSILVALRCLRHRGWCCSPWDVCSSVGSR